MLEAEIVVIGGGAMGSAAAWQLATRGRSVVLLERFEPGHRNGASHGTSRNFNTAYAEQPYLTMLAESLRLWRELEAETGTRLLDQVGVVHHGADPAHDRVAAALPSVGLSAEFVALPEAAERWPGIRFDRRVLFTPEAGRLNAEAAVAAMQTAAGRSGAEIRHQAPVRSIEVVDDKRARVHTATEIIEARRVVVAAGAWTSKLLADLVPLRPLAVTQEQPAHFALADDSGQAAAAAATGWPGFNHYRDPADPRYDYWYSPVYGMYTPGVGVKAGWHGVGPIVDPDARTFLPEPAQLAALQRYVRDWLPGADANRMEPISCTYTTTPTEDFLLDRVGPLVVAAGFSGHGFKFTPAVGRILADLALDAAAAPRSFALA